MVIRDKINIRKWFLVDNMVKKIFPWDTQLHLLLFFILVLMIGMWLLYNAYKYFSCFTWLLALNISTSFYEPQLRDCVLFQCTLMADRSWTLAHVYLSFVRMKVNWFSLYRFIWHYTFVIRPLTQYLLYFVYVKYETNRDLLLWAYEYLICIIKHQKIKIKMTNSNDKPELLIK